MADVEDESDSWRQRSRFGGLGASFCCLSVECFGMGASPSVLDLLEKLHVASEVDRVDYCPADDKC
jgi:hypothetical protein